MDEFYQMGFKRVLKPQYLIIIALWLAWPTMALAQQPPQPTVVISTTAAFGTGQLYTDLVSATNQILKPLDDFATNSHAQVTEDGGATATTAASSIGNIFGYLGFFSSIGLSFTFLALPIGLYFLIKLVKVILSAIKYIKQLVAQWV